MSDMSIYGRVTAALLIFTASILSCRGKNEAGDETVIKFEGGTVSMDEIQKRSGSRIAELRKREDEIRYRTALQILMEKIGAMEKKDPAASLSGDDSGKKDVGAPAPKNLPVGKNGPGSDDIVKEGKRTLPVPEGEELRKLFIKYKVQSSLKMPE